MFKYLVLLFFLKSPLLCESVISSMTYIPQGINPKLYEVGFDPIMHLDYLTFDDTVFRQNHAFLVEFYADWYAAFIYA